MSPARCAHEIESFLVNRESVADMVYCVHDILNGKVRTTGVWSPIGASKIGVKESPILFDTPLSHWDTGLLLVVTAPGVKTDEQGNGLVMSPVLREIEERRLFGAVK